MRDVDGDTPLHAACRCGAPIEVIEVLLHANPHAVRERDYEGLTPLLRLWVRYFVILGDDVIQNVKGPGDFVGELGEAWSKTELLLRCAYHGVPPSCANVFIREEGPPEEQQLPAGEQPQQQQQQPLVSLQEQQYAADLKSGGIPGITKGLSYQAGAFNTSFQAVHAAAAVDCPRPVVKIATIIYPHQADEKDQNGLTPLLIAARAPIFKVRDLSDEGYLLEDRIHGDNVADGDENNDNENDDNSPGQPSVIEILLSASELAACVPNPEGRLPIHLALECGKQWNQGIKDIIQCYPEALCIPDSRTGLVPFQIAATTTAVDLTTVFEVVRYNPSLLQLAPEKTNNVVIMDGAMDHDAKMQEH